jgi:hypothetical protein
MEIIERAGIVIPDQRLVDAGGEDSIMYLTLELTLAPLLIATMINDLAAHLIDLYHKRAAE